MNKTDFLNPCIIHIFLFLSTSFGMETMDTFIHTYEFPLGPHTRLQTKMGKVYTCFQTKTAQKLYPLGRHIPTWEYPPPRESRQKETLEIESEKQEIRTSMMVPSHVKPSPAKPERQVHVTPFPSEG